MRPLTPRQFEAVLKRFGWTFHHSTGSHKIWKSPEGKTATIAIHGNKQFRQGTQLAMIRQTGIPKEEFENA